MTQYRIFSTLGQKLALPGRFRWLGTGSLWAYRVLTWVVLAAGLAFAAAVLALRYWVLPNIADYRDDIARIVSERARQKITIGRIHASWDGLRPQLVLEQVTVYDASGQPALELSRVDNTLSWLSLATLELRFYALDIYRPVLNVRRDARGVVSVAGIELADGGSGKGDGNGFADWLLRQRDIEIHDATVVWNDELRAAPQLELKRVFLHAVSSGGRHRFGLRATPPPELAAPLDLRGDVRGSTIQSLGDWKGKLFIQLDYADIAAWRTWVPFPIEFPRGAGALRAWLTFSRDRLVEAVADVRLAGVQTRLASDLPQLDLAELAGRIGWKQSDAGFEVTTSRLRVVTTGGLNLPPSDLLLRLGTTGTRGQAGGELRADALELAPLVALADHLPLGNEARQRLAEYSPRGSLDDVVVRWSGEWREPKQYSVRGRFRNLSLHRAGKVPGFAGVSGTLEASERGGALFLNSLKASVEMPLVFRESHQFDTLSAQVAWTRSGEETELRLNNISFSNAHLAGTLMGIYRTSGATRGAIDLTGRLTRADARFASRYVPLAVGKNARAWLDAAFVAGRSNNVTLRLKGNLDEFPFADGKDGVFQVTARITDGVLHYADGWPDIGSIAGDLIFRGQRMDVHAWQGALFGVRLGKVRVELPDLLSADQVLNVSGEAEGPTSDFLAFIEKSPVLDMTDHFTEGWQAQGAGRLTLKFTVPLRGAAKGAVAGAYQFAGNTVVIAPRLPAVEQAGGRVEFTESSVRVPGVKGVMLGGPLALSATSQRDAAVRVSVQGRINTDAARRAGAPPWTENIRGAADWRASLVARKRSADVVVESNLQGLAVDLPAPLVKAAPDILPVRFERRFLAAGRDRVAFSAGDIVSMILLRRTEGDLTTITRGTVRFGGVASEPDRDGVWMSGTVQALDIDRWLDLYGRDGGGGGDRVEWGGIDIRLGALDLLGRRFSDLGVNAAFQGGRWRAALSGTELDGSASWQPQGAGRIDARMKTFAIPPPSPAAEAAREPQPRRDPQDLPAVDIIAEQFINKGRLLGRLEATAAPEGRNWRIERLRLTNPESAVTIDGLWQVGTARQRTQFNLRLEVNDIGKLLARLGYPEGVQRGTARMEGTVAWAGSPYELDYPTLTGNLKLDAAKGQFVKLDPGIAKLLGVLSLQSLPRRLSLDFRDVLSDGFAFDEINGTVAVTRGRAVTDNFRIVGPAAHILMKGGVDLAQETQTIRVRITPQVTESVAVAGALVGGPVAGIAAYLAQKMLKDPFGNLASFEYDVTGTWSDPAVKRVPRPKPDFPVSPE